MGSIQSQGEQAGNSLLPAQSLQQGKGMKSVGEGPQKELDSFGNCRNESNDRFGN
jgi:hypothetical protein